MIEVDLTVMALELISWMKHEARRKNTVIKMLQKNDTTGLAEARQLLAYLPEPAVTT